MFVSHSSFYFRLEVLDNDFGELRNISYGNVDSDEGPTIAEVTYDCEKTRLRDQEDLDGKMWKTFNSDEQSSKKTPYGRKRSKFSENQNTNNSISKRKSDKSPIRKRYDSDDSPPRRHDSDASPHRKRYDSDASPPARHDSDASPPRRRHDSDASPPRRYDSDASPPRRRHDSDASPPRRYDSDASPPRNKHDLNTSQSQNNATGLKTREFAHMTTREFLAARKSHKLKNKSAEDIARQEREAKLQDAAEETHRKMNRGIAQNAAHQQRQEEIIHEMGKGFARSANDTDYNDYHKSKTRG